MNKKMKDTADLMRQLVSDIQGAPYPSDVSSELYKIWYEHIQRDAINALGFIDENFPLDHTTDIENTIKKAF